jgi:hypothetical protein
LASGERKEEKRRREKIKVTINLADKKRTKQSNNTKTKCHHILTLRGENKTQAERGEKTM